MRQSLQIAAWVILTTMFLTIVYVAYLAFAPVKVFTINSIHMITPQVHAGDDAIYHVDYCRYFSGNIHVFKSIDGPSLIYIPESVNSNPSGCRTADVHVNIPTSALSGKYVIKITAEAEVNQIKKVSIKYQTDSFEVISHE